MTPEQRKVIADVVVDPDAWYSHAVETLGQEAALAAVAQKVERHRAAYEARASSGNYKTRAQRNMTEEAERDALISARVTAITQARAEERARIIQIVREEIAKTPAPPGS